MPSLISKVVVAGLKLVDFSGRLEKAMEARDTQSAKPPAKLLAKYDVAHTGKFENGVYHFKGKNDGRKVIVYYHGGAYVFGLLSLHWPMVDKFMKAGVDHLYVVDYPLAFDAQAPEVLDMALAAYETAAAEHGAENITIMGDSAGGGMSMAVAQMLRAAGKPQPKQLVLISPWFDASMQSEALPALESGDPVLSAGWLRKAADMYRGPLPVDDPLISPMHADLTGLAPITYYMAGDELFVDDGRKFARIAAEQGIRVDHREWEGLMHDFPAFPLIPEANKAIKEIVAMA